MSKSAREILEEARELISRPSGWTTGCYARDRSGREEQPESDVACSFCALGAIYHASRGGDYKYEAEDALRAACSGVTGTIWVADFNDAEGRTQAEVVALYDAAIKLLDEQGDGT